MVAARIGKDAMMTDPASISFGLKEILYAVGAAIVTFGAWATKRLLNSPTRKEFNDTVNAMRDDISGVHERVDETRKEITERLDKLIDRE